MEERGQGERPRQLSQRRELGRAGVAVWGCWGLGIETPSVALGGSLLSHQPPCDPRAPAGLAGRPQPQPQRHTACPHPGTPRVSPPAPLARPRTPGRPQRPRAGARLHVLGVPPGAPLTASRPQCCGAIYSSVSGLKAHLAGCSKVSAQTPASAGSGSPGSRTLAHPGPTPHLSRVLPAGVPRRRGHKRACCRGLG